MPARLEHLAQLALGKGNGILEHDVLNLDLPPRVKLEDDHRLAKRLFVPDLVPHLGLVVAPFLVFLLQEACVGENSRPVEGLPGAGADFFAKLVSLELAATGIALEQNLRDHRLAHQRVGHLHSAGNLLVSHVNVLKKPGVAEVVNVVITGFARVGFACLESDIGPDQLLAGRRLPLVLNDYFLNQPRPGSRAADLPQSLSAPHQHTDDDRLAKRAQPPRRVSQPAGRRRC